MFYLHWCSDAQQQFVRTYRNFKDKQRQENSQSVVHVTLFKTFKKEK